MAGREKRVDGGDTRGKGEEKQKEWHKIKQAGNRGEEVWTEKKKRGEIYKICWQRNDKAGKGKRGKRKVNQSVKMCRKRKFQGRKQEGRSEKESITSKGGQHRL